MKQQSIKTIAIKDLVTITPDTTLPEANRIMKDNGVRRLPVVSDGELVGIVSLSDIQEADPSDATSLSIWELNYLLAKLKVEKIMTRNPITVTEDASLREVARIMLDNKIGGLPVVDSKGKMVGIITESDVFRVVADEFPDS